MFNKIKIKLISSIFGLYAVVHSVGGAEEIPEGWEIVDSEEPVLGSGLEILKTNEEMLFDFELTAGAGKSSLKIDWEGFLPLFEKVCNKCPGIFPDQSKKEVSNLEEERDIARLPVLVAHFDYMDLTVSLYQTKKTGLKKIHIHHASASVTIEYQKGLISTSPIILYTTPVQMENYLVV